MVVPCIGIMLYIIVFCPFELQEYMLFVSLLLGDFTDLATITDPPTSITVNESESATFDCTATDVGDLTIEWDVGGVLYNNETCSDTCGSINTVNNNRHVTSTLAITGETDLDISCVVIQRSMTSSSNEPGVEMRLYGRLERAAQLMVIPTVTTAATTQPETTQPTNTQGPDVGRTDGKKDDLLNFTLGQEIVNHRNPLALST